MRKDIGEIIRAIKYRGMFCGRYERCVTASENSQDPELKLVDSFSVSLDGDKKSHDRFVVRILLRTHLME